MSTSTLDQQTASTLVATRTTSSTADRSASLRSASWVRVAGLMIGAAAILVVVGLATDVVAATLGGVVLGVATAFVVSCREMGDKPVTTGTEE